MKRLLLMLLVAFISGCVGVASVNPVGTQVVKLDSEDWNGVWSDGSKSIYFIKVKDEDKGILHIGYVDEKDGTFEMKTFDAHIRSSGKEQFCNIKVAEVLEEKELKKCSDQLKNSYYWLLINNGQKNLSVFLPNAENVQKLTKEKNIESVKSDEAILIEGESKKITEFIQSYKNGELYFWKKPLLLQRILEK